MNQLSHHDILIMFLALGSLLAAARVFGEVARRFNQPAVLGEILAGIILGPTVMGTLFPHFLNTLFPSEGPVAGVMQGLTTLAIVLFMLVAGMEVDLSTVWRQGRAAFSVGLSGMFFPFVLGFLVAWFWPQRLGKDEGVDLLIFALFMATALAISALPVIAKTLMDLNVYRSDLGMIIIAAAIFNDLAGWIIFAVILAMMGVGAGHGAGAGMTIAMTLGFTVLTLTAARWVIHRVLPWVQAHTSWPGGVLGLALSLALLGAAATEWIGVHALFGAFLVGVAIGDSSHMREHTRNIIGQFVSFIFAPLFFASIGLRANFVSQFEWGLVVMVLVIACLGKVIGCGLGARWSGMAPREAWAVGFGMNARGAMEIVLGTLALQYKLINEKVFVALVVMALITSLISGPAMQRLLRLKKPRRLTDYSGPRAFLNPVPADHRRGAIRALAESAAAAAGLNADAVDAAVWSREQIMSTGVGQGIAVPHARMYDLAAPVVAIGLCKEGIDFNAPDGEAAQFIFLILTPEHDNGAQIEILADVARTFGREEVRHKALQVRSYTEFLALLRTDSDLHGATMAVAGA